MARTDSFRSDQLLTGKVSTALLRMALPMLAGTFALNAYNLTDTWFVAQLGTGPLAAMAFTFPVVMVLRFITMGLGTGALTVIGGYLGGGDRAQAARLSTHALILSVLVAILIMVLGMLSVRPLFELLGAQGEVLEMVMRYMRIWYAGAIVIIVPSVMNQVLMSTGDSKAASITMMLGTGLNLVLDPIMIFGWLGFPAMGISGAALATVLAQVFSLFYPLYVLSRRHQLICRKVPQLSALLHSWGQILTLGIPSILGNLLAPLSMALITRLIAGYGAAAVAASGATGRLEMFAFMIPMSVGMSLVPFVAQNFGAGRYDRIAEVQSFSWKFALIYGAFTSLMFFLFAPSMAQWFSDDPKVIEIMVMAIRIVCFAYGLMESFRYSMFCLTGIQKPVLAALLNLLRCFVLLVPLSYAGAWGWGLVGIFVARLLSDSFAAFVGMTYSRKIIVDLRRNNEQNKESGSEFETALV